MCEYGYSCFFLGLCFFSHARIGLLVEPGRETEKLIIVPLKKWEKKRNQEVAVNKNNSVRTRT